MIVKHSKKENCKNKYKIGDKLKIIEYGNGGIRYYVTIKVENVINKELYNMYVCRNMKTKCRVTITDLDEHVELIKIQEEKK